MPGPEHRGPFAIIEKLKILGQHLPVKLVEGNGATSYDGTPQNKIT